MSRRKVAAVVLGLSLLAGCGGGEDLSVAAEGTLTRDVEAIAAAARADDAVRLQELVLELRRHVEELQADGEVSSGRAEEILAAAARVATDVGLPEPEVVVSVVPAPPRSGGGDEAEQPEDEGDDDEGDDDKGDDEGSEDKGKSDDGKEKGKGD